MKVICFGAGMFGKSRYNSIAKKYEILAFADNDESKQGKFLFECEIISPNKIKDYPYDYIIITTNVYETAVQNQLIEMGIDKFKIIMSYASYYERRIEWLRSLSELQADIVKSAEVAEAGVYKGDFARYINRFYPDRKLHLFDTFEGFSSKDIQAENGLSTAKVGDLAYHSEEIVISKMEHPEKVCIHKGYFPQTAEGITSQFCFVNLDVDLYQPTLAGLRLFAPKMVKDGVIIIHDYFYGDYEKSIKKAVHEFMDETEYKNLRLIPIGDGLSIAIVGF